MMRGVASEVLTCRSLSLTCGLTCGRCLWSGVTLKACVQQRHCPVVGVRPTCLGGALFVRE